MLAYEEYGSGKTLVLLHGFLESKEMWKPLKLGAFFHCLAIDLNGHGATKYIPEYPSLKDYAQQVWQLLEQKGIRDFHVVGHSMGGYVALEMSLDERMKGKTVLVHSNFWTDTDSKKKDRIRMAQLAIKNSSLVIRETFPGLFLNAEANKEFIQFGLKHNSNMTGEAVAGACLAMKDRQCFRDVVADNEKDYVFIQGALDPIVALRDGLENCFFMTHFYILEKAGHMGHVEDPEGLTAILCTQLK